MTEIDAKELFGNFRDSRKFIEKKAGSETRLEWPMQIADGFAHYIHLRPGFLIGICDFNLVDKTSITFNDHYCALTFNFGLCGEMNTKIDTEGGCKDVCNLKPGHTAINYLPQWHSLSVDATLKWISICVDPLLLETMIETNPDRMPVVLYELSKGADENHFHQICPTDFCVDMALNQVLSCPYQGFLKRLYLESKALELITHSLARLVPPEAETLKPFTLRPQDIERVHYARELVAGNLQDPPKLLELARSVGLPHPKLNFGFREIYGTTIFDYLRQTRLNKARELLNEGRMNVTEVAYAVGYSSLSYFAKSFKHHHGTAPGTYLRKVLRKGLNSPSRTG